MEYQGKGLVLDTAIDYIVMLWPMMVAFVGVIAWLVKVDTRTMDNAKTIARVEKESSDSLERLESRIDKRRMEDMTRLERTLGTMSADIKTLLQRGA